MRSHLDMAGIFFKVFQLRLSWPVTRSIPRWLTTGGGMWSEDDRLTCFLNNQSFVVFLDFKRACDLDAKLLSSFQDQLIWLFGSLFDWYWRNIATSSMNFTNFVFDWGRSKNPMRKTSKFGASTGPRGTPQETFTWVGLETSFTTTFCFLSSRKIRILLILLHLLLPFLFLFLLLSSSFFSASFSSPIFLFLF